MRTVVDTGVIVEYIDRKGELHKQASLLFSTMNAGKVEVDIPHPVLTETYYVSARLYRSLGLSDFLERAAKLVKWLYSHPMVRTVEGLDLALKAGEIKMRYGLALTDCYVLATSEMYGCPAVFRKVEREMLPRIEELKGEFRVIFLEDYA
ncbi:MAG: PIN domain-containing protein [Candidatus Korarchaeota archaeon]|nr:PIN domain-containing protein [Candidatus Korarchaeota archaeon]